MKTFMQKITFNLWVVVHPRYWVMNTSYDKEWDIKVNQYIDKGFDLVDSHYDVFPNKEKFNNNTYVIRVYDSCIWIQNYPYAYCVPVVDSVSYNIRPSRQTIRRFRRYIKNHKNTNPEYYL